MKRVDSPRAQRGVALVAVMLLAALIVSAIVVEWTLVRTAQVDRALSREQAAYLSAVEASLTQWYALNSASIDAAAEAPDLNAVLRSLGVAARWNLQVRASRTIERDNVRYRTMALWLPRGADDSTSFDVNAGTLSATPQTLSRAINGWSVQSRAVSETRKRMQSMAERLEANARAQYLLDPSRDALKNRFRALDCAAPRAGELPCLDTYRAARTLVALGTLGIGSALSTNAWGGDIEVSNSLDSQTSEPPFSMALRTVTPWGATIRVTAVQAL